jgi:hypothetical protein
MWKEVVASGLAVTSSMVGTVTLIAPICFYQNGILYNTIVLIFFSLLYGRTCQLWTIHSTRH